MATIKINYGGTVYSMVKTSSKITTPSIKVDGGYIPCFKGDRFSEVLNGSLYYTLSPVCVNGYRLACGTRTGFSGNVNLRISYNINVSSSSMGPSQCRTTLTMSYSSYSVSTTQTGFTAAISNFSFSPTSDSESMYHNSAASLSVRLNSKCSGNVTVKDSSGTVVKTFSFSINVNDSYSKHVSGQENFSTSTSSTYQIG